MDQVNETPTEGQPQEKYCVPQVLLPANLAPIAGAAAVEEKRFALQSVRVVVERGGIPGAYLVEATDGCCLVRVVGSSDDPNDFPCIDGFDGYEGGEKEGLIPVGAWREAFKALPKRPLKPVLRNVALALGKTDAMIGVTDLEQALSRCTRLVEGRYPPTNEIMPKTKPLTRARIDARVLMRCLAVIEAVRGGGGDEQCGFWFNFYGEDRALTLETRNVQTGQEVIAVVMPLTIDKDPIKKQKKDEERQDKKTKLRQILGERTVAMYNALRSLVRPRKKPKDTEAARRLVAEIKKEFVTVDAWEPKPELPDPAVQVAEYEEDEEVAEETEQTEGEGDDA